MALVQIFIEGKKDSVDIKFFEDLLDFMGKDLANVKIQPIGGYNSIEEAGNIYSMKENVMTGGVNLVVLDTDGDLAARIAYLEKVKKDFKVEFYYFLVPNHEHPGCIENLILNILPDGKYVDLLDCFDQYKNCIFGHGEKYVPPDIKHKLFAFFACTGQGTKGSKIDFKNPQFYNLSSDYLNPLKKFFEKYI